MNKIGFSEAVKKSSSNRSEAAAEDTENPKRRINRLFKNDMDDDSYVVQSIESSASTENGSSYEPPMKLGGETVSLPK